MAARTLTQRHPESSVAELVADATDRVALDGHDGKSGAALERVTINGERFVLKHLGIERDWVARASGDVGHRAAAVWQWGLLDALPAVIDHAVVGCAVDGRSAAVLMRDVSPWLVPDGDHPFAMEHHRRFLDHMATGHVEFWGFADTLGLLPLENRFLLLSPVVAQTEQAFDGNHAVPLQLMPSGWKRLPRIAPRTASIVSPLLRDPSPLVRSLRTTPTTLLHGDWKAANLGRDASGRTILLDWAVPGEGPAAFDLAWYLAINASRLPETKEGAIATYRAALERHGIDTDPWWERQVGLCLLGAFLLLGWEKALGHQEELAWWERRVLDAVRWLS